MRHKQDTDRQGCQCGKTPRKRWHIPLYGALPSMVMVGAFATAVALPQDDVQENTTAMVPPVVQEPGTPILLAASSDEHQWYIRTRQIDTTRTYVPLHHGPGMDDPTRVSVIQQPLMSTPEAIAAVDNLLYIVFRPETVVHLAAPQGDVGRTVIVLRAITFDERTGKWLHATAGQARTLPSLPAAGRVVGFEVYPDCGPVALIRTVDDPPPPTGAPVGIADEKAADEADGLAVDGPPEVEDRGYHLFRLSGSQWQRCPLDSIYADGAPTGMKLLAGQFPTLLVAGPVGPALWKADPDRIAQWTNRGTLILPPSDIEDSVEYHERSFVLTRTTGSKPPGISLILDDSTLLPIATLAPFDGARRLIKAGPSLGIVSQISASSSLQLTLVDVETGLIGQPGQIEPRTPLTADWFRSLILIAGLLLAGVVMFVFRPERRTAPLTLAPGTSVAEPQVRFLAIVIDLVLCALPALFITGGSPSDLIRTPLLASTWSQVMPPLTMYGLCCLYSLVTEWLTGRTAGKALFNLRVATIAGAKPGLLQSLVRNLMKLIVLLIPPLILFVFMNPLRQRLGDQAACTIVVLVDDEPDRNDESGRVAQHPKSKN